jgi:hypothetical protein
MEWNGVVNVYVPLFGLVKIQWSGMEYDGTHSILYHPIFSFFILPIWSICSRIKTTQTIE